MAATMDKRQSGWDVCLHLRKIVDTKGEFGMRGISLAMSPSFFCALGRSSALKVILVLLVT